jgi:hypothetical protein
MKTEASLNLGKVREVKSNALERRHLASFVQGLNWKMMENETSLVFQVHSSNNPENTRGELTT